MANKSLVACLVEIKAHPGEFYAYILSRPCGTPFYVGIGTRSRISTHTNKAKTATCRHPKSRVFREVWAAGEEIDHRIVGFFSRREDVKREEVRLIGQIGRLDLGLGPLVNRTDGGDLPAPMTISGRERLRQFRLGCVVSEETRRKIGDIHRGKVMSLETRKKMSASRGGRAPCRIAIENSRKANLGRALTEEHKAKLRAAKTGRTLPPEHRQNIASALRGRVVPEETRRKLWASNLTRKPTIVDGVEYRSRTDAMRALGIGRKMLDRLTKETRTP